MIVLINVFFRRSPESQDIASAEQHEHQTNRELHCQAKLRDRKAVNVG